MYVDKLASRTVTGSILHDAGMLLRFESPVLLFSTPILNCYFVGEGNFTCSIKGKSSTVSCSMSYGFNGSISEKLKTDALHYNNSKK